MRCSCGSNYVKASANNFSFSLGKYTLWDQLLPFRWQNMSLLKFSFSPITQNSMCSRGFEMSDSWKNTLIFSFNANESRWVLWYTIKNLFVLTLPEFSKITQILVFLNLQKMSFPRVQRLSENWCQFQCRFSSYVLLLGSSCLLQDWLGQKLY